jgi:hypothetical protein
MTTTPRCFSSARFSAFACATLDGWQMSVWTSHVPAVFGSRHTDIGCPHIEHLSFCSAMKANSRPRSFSSHSRNAL